MTTASVNFATIFHPKYISFDCYGTLIRFQMLELARDFFADRLSPEAMDCRVFVGRGHEPSSANNRDIEILHIECLPAMVGL